MLGPIFLAVSVGWGGVCVCGGGGRREPRTVVFIKLMVRDLFLRAESSSGLARHSLSHSLLAQPAVYIDILLFMQLCQKYLNSVVFSDL